MGELDETHLEFPPPFASMHFGKYSGLLVRGSIVFLWGVGQERCKLRVAVENTDTLDDIPIIKFVLLTGNRNFLPGKLRKSTRELFVNDAV